MISFLFVMLTLWLLWGFIKFSWNVTWGVFKLIGIILSIIAFPLIFGMIFTVGVTVFALIPLLLLGLAFGCLAKKA